MQHAHLNQAAAPALGRLATIALVCLATPVGFVLLLELVISR